MPHHHHHRRWDLLHLHWKRPVHFLSETLPMVAAAVLIVFFAVIRQQTFLKTLPTLVTLVVQVMMARANRYGFLVGGCNAVLYGLAYWSEGLFFSAISAALFSFPMQVYSFFQWKNHSKDGVVSFRILKRRDFLLWTAGTLLGWVGCVLFLGPVFAGSDFLLPDSFLFVSGIVVTILSAVRYLESQYLSLISSVVSIGMYVVMVFRDPADMNYLIISVYNLFRVIQTAVRWTKIYLDQKKERVS